MSDGQAERIDLSRHFERIITGHRTRCSEPETDAERLTRELNAPEGKSDDAKQTPKP